jgi:hypothetical protein
MLRRAKQIMEQEGAQFVFTGEVLGQRPMSQHKRALGIVANESGLDGLLVRPLSAKLLPPTIPEINGWLDREKLGSISGRSRREQYRLAEEMGVTEYSQPAGGCCSLADKNYALRMRDLLDHMQDGKIPGLDDVILLKVGRHFRPFPNLKIVVGRDEVENKFLERYASDGRAMLCSIDVMGPVTIAEGNLGAEAIEIAAALTARYSDLDGMTTVRVKYETDSTSGIVEVKPSAQNEIEAWRI